MTKGGAANGDARAGFSPEEPTDGQQEGSGAISAFVSVDGRAAATAGRQAPLPVDVEAVRNVRLT